VTAYAMTASDPTHNPYIEVSTNYSGDGTSEQWDQPDASWWDNFANALPGAFSATITSNASAVGNSVKQLGYTLADVGNDLQYDLSFGASYIENWGDLTQTSGEAYYNGHLSAVEQAIDTGQLDPLSLAYANQSTQGVANAVTFGTYGEGQATFQYLSGGINANQYGNQLAVGAFTNFVSAATLPAGANVDLGVAAQGAAIYGGGFWEGLNAGGGSVYTPSLLGGIQGVVKDVLAAHRSGLEAVELAEANSSLVYQLLDGSDIVYYGKTSSLRFAATLRRHSFGSNSQPFTGLQILSGNLTELEALSLESHLIAVGRANGLPLRNILSNSLGGEPLPFEVLQPKLQTPTVTILPLAKAR
jgi:hypothetical protein